MPTTELSPADPRLLATATLLISLFIAGVSAWETVWRRYCHQQQQPWLDRCEEPRAKWGSFPERLVLLLTSLWLGLHLAARLMSSETATRSVLTNAGLIQESIAELGTVLVLIGLLAGSGQRSLAEFGFKWSPLSSQLRDGWFGFRLAILPMAVSMAMTIPLKTPESQHALLRLLANNPDYLKLALIVFIPVVSAPLLEELIFRVILQSALSQIVRPRLAILAIAVIFSAVHGPVDGLTLLPLALVLGSIFHRRHSYLTVVVIHGLFNATMLALAMLTATDKEHGGRDELDKHRKFGQSLPSVPSSSSFESFARLHVPVSKFIAHEFSAR